MAKRKPFKRRLKPTARQKQLQKEFQTETGQTVEIVGQTGESMSQALMNLVEPYMLDWGQDASGLEMLARLGVMAWNETILPESMIDKAIADFVHSLPAEEKKEAEEVVRSLLEELQERKMLLYPHNKRLMIDVEIDIDRRGPYFQVISTPPMNDL